MRDRRPELSTGPSTCPGPSWWDRSHMPMAGDREAGRSGVLAEGPFGARRTGGNAAFLADVLAGFSVGIFVRCSTFTGRVNARADIVLAPLKSEESEAWQFMNCAGVRHTFLQTDNTTSPAALR